jgi:hypothetical protein
MPIRAHNLIFLKRDQNVAKQILIKIRNWNLGCYTRAAGEVMTLLPRDTGTCSLCIIKGDDITPSDA